MRFVQSNLTKEDFPTASGRNISASVRQSPSAVRVHYHFVLGGHVWAAPLGQGSLAVLRTSRARSCLRPVSGRDRPLALMVDPLGSLPQSSERVHIDADP